VNESAPAIVTDSTSVETADAERLEIDMVPLMVNFGDRHYRDRIDLSRAEFYRMFTQTLPTTSQPSSAMFEQVFAPHVAAGRPVICVTISQAYSGTVQAAQAAAHQFPGAEIHVIDSGTIAGGVALQVIRAAELAWDGADAATVLAALARDRERQRGYATIPDLSHAVRTGRVSRAQAFIGSLVKIVPVLRIGTKVEEEARVRTFARAQEAMVSAVVRDAGPVAGARIAVVHANAPDAAAALAERIRERLAAPPAFLAIYEAGPVIAAHTGPGTVGVFVVPG
jgi:DegV family protein with EDD domain